MIFRIDDDFCQRFIESLPEQEIAYDPEEDKIVPLNEHWIGQMIEEALTDDDKSRERFSAMIKAQFPLLRKYAVMAGRQHEMTPEMIDAFILELVAFFAFNMAKKAHEEAIERMHNGEDESGGSQIGDEGKDS